MEPKSFDGSDTVLSTFFSTIFNIIGSKSDVYLVSRIHEFLFQLLGTHNLKAISCSQLGHLS